jgi:uncharacterized repeat protein (TIGR03843 family)
MTATSEVRDVLLRGELTVKGRLPWSSNATFLVEATLDSVCALAVYKPERGERPLWDFPPGLFRRELAAWHLSEALGWDLVPLTVRRDRGPFGEGSLQRFVAADFEQHYFTLREEARHHERLKRICAFDLIANNADRKSGHCLLGEDGTIYAIDNGLCFHVEPKLRTVIWDFAGEELPDDVVSDLRRLRSVELEDRFGDLLEEDELEALARRLGALAERPCLPSPRGDPEGWRHYPWPLV